MKVKAIRAKLIEGLNLVKDACEGKEKLNVLTNIKVEAESGCAPGAVDDEEFDRIVLTATNLDTQIQVAIPCQMSKAGSACLVGRRLVDFVSALPEGEVEIELNSSMTKAIISGGECIYTLAALDGKEFPMMRKPGDGDEHDKVVELTLRATIFKEILKKVKYASATDGQRKSLEGVNIKLCSDRLRASAADGKRLSVCEYECEIGCDEERSFTFPNKAIKQLYGLLDKCSDTDEIAISCDGRSALVESKGWNFGAKMIEDVFPNISKAIPAETSDVATIERAAFLQEVERANLASDKDSLAIKVTFEQDKVRFEGRDSDVSKYRSNIPAKLAGESADFWMNARLLKDVLGNISDDQVTIGFNGKGSPVVIKCSIPFVGVIMPLRLD